MVEILLILLSAVPGAVEAPSPPLPWHNPANWQRLAVDQSSDAVRRTLGEPLAAEESTTRLIWYYQSAPTPDTEGRPVRPQHGLVIFRKTADAALLLRVAEPIWADEPSWAERQQQWQDAQRAMRQAAAAPTATVTERPLPRPAVAPAPAPVVYRPAAERPAASIPPAAPDERVQLHTRYWLSAAGVFIALALGIALSQGCKFFR